MDSAGHVIIQIYINIYIKIYHYINTNIDLTVIIKQECIHFVETKGGHMKSWEKERGAIIYVKYSQSP